MAQESVLSLISVPLKLPSEYLILSPEVTPPARDSQKYVQIVETDGGKMVFNPISNNAPETATKSVTVSGVTIVLENTLKYPLFSTLSGRTDLRYLTIAADEVIIRSPLHVPGTSVTIHARILRFESAGSINTTPPSITMRAEQHNAAAGAPAGNICLYVKTLEALGNEKRLIANGADGQPAQLGEKGDNGHSLPEWNGKWKIKNHWGAMEELDWSGNLRGNTNGYAPVHATLLAYYEEGGRYHENDRPDEYWGNVWPGNGAPPKRMPGIPGRGGAGGDVRSHFKDLLAARTEQGAGRGGKRADDLLPSQPGTPVKSCAVRVHYVSVWFVHTQGTGDGNAQFLFKYPKERFRLGETHEAVGHPAVSAPAAPQSDRAGKQEALSDREKALWLSPLAVQALISYARDAHRAEKAASLRPLIDEYLAAFATLDAFLRPAASTSAVDAAVAAAVNSALAAALAAGLTNLTIELHAVATELRALAQQIDSPLDHYGNPAGWVPGLSFESNYAAFETETREAMARLYLSHWIEHNQAAAVARVSTFKTTLDHLKKDTKAAIKTYNDGRDELAAAGADHSALSTDIAKFTTALEQLETDVTRVAKGNLEHEKMLRGVAKLLGGLAQVIPVGQPALLAVGKGITELADLDPEKPWDSVKKIGSAVWDTQLVSEKLLPKVKDVATKFLEIQTSEEDEKSEFDKEVAKKTLGNKVKAHIKAQSDAKEQMTKALGSFSVSADELKAAVQKALAKCPEYKEISEKLKKLNVRKAEVAERLLRIAQRLDDATNTVVNNRLTEIELRGALATTAKELTPEGLRYARAMGERAMERLRRYEYYFLKSYTYAWLRTPTFESNSEYLFKALASAVQLKGEAVLSGDQFERLGVVFRENLKSVADQMLTYYNTHTPDQAASGGKFTLELSETQLEALNSEDKSVTIDPMADGKLHLGLEDVRILDIKIIKAELKDPPAVATNVRLRVKHPGDSTLRREGKLYLFRNTARHWGAMVNHVEGRTKITAQTPDPMDQTIIQTVTGAVGNQLTLRSRPSAWSTLVVERELMDMASTYPAKFSKVIMEVHYTARDVNVSHVSLFVNVPRPLEPVIKCSPPDLGAHGDGAGRFMRTYHKQTSEVTLTAPESYGEHAFMGWRLRGRAGEGAPNQMMPLLTPESARNVELSTLVRTPTLRVPLTNHQLIEAVYAQRAR